jgi:anti-sigma factor RsiW
MTCPEMIAIGAYILGALSLDDRLEMQRHLDDCEACREELLRLAPLPGLLHAVDVHMLDFGV